VLRYTDPIGSDRTGRQGDPAAAATEAEPEAAILGEAASIVQDAQTEGPPPEQHPGQLALDIEAALANTPHAVTRSAEPIEGAATECGASLHASAIVRPRRDGSPPFDTVGPPGGPGPRGRH
jgi:hypothetical protein